MSLLAQLTARTMPLTRWASWTDEDEYRAGDLRHALPDRRAVYTAIAPVLGSDNVPQVQIIDFYLVSP